MSQIVKVDMNKVIATLLLFFFMTAGVCKGREVILSPGETFRQEDLTVRCRENTVVSPLAVTTCQIWDDYDKKCLFEKTVYSVGDLECVKECQHWDDYNDVCLYATTCRYLPEHRAFTQTRCDNFDSYAQKCLQEKQVKIVP